MICSAMQPSYIPWSGFYNLISNSDKFVFLDDAQFQKNSWHNRNRILVNHSPHWISVPIKHDKLEQKIYESEIVNSQPWKRKHVKLLQQTYCKHQYSGDILEITDYLENENFNNLAELNIRIIKWFLKKLDILTDIHLSSEMNIDGRRTLRLIKILEKLGADTYLSPIGAMEYLKVDEFSKLTDIELKFQEFNPLPYPQYRHEQFESHLSMIDVVANIGWEASKKYIA